MTTTTRFHNWMTLDWHTHLTDSLASAEPKLAQQIEARLEDAVVVGPEDILLGRVQFGSIVTVFGIEEEEEQTFQIVSHDQAQTAPGLLSEGSPLAQALFSAKEGDVVVVILGNGANSHYEVTHIRVPS